MNTRIHVPMRRDLLELLPRRPENGVPDRSALVFNGRRTRGELETVYGDRRRRLARDRLSENSVYKAHACC